MPPPDPISSCVDGHGNGDRSHVWKDLDSSPHWSHNFVPPAPSSTSSTRAPRSSSQATCKRSLNLSWISCRAPILHAGLLFLGILKQEMT
ncbi:hypothetical protein BDA96_03G341600 [Sorghum bicolor]|uniref:Uncharacterized protein n=1 Tax=Sorghum bicolor TaxID=4558 RepID=A0A921UPH4_SORBI|nr:hypothetical protein BDA96_03G341600 [Sorghum bicolor]